MKKADLSAYDFVIAFPKLGRNENPRIASFVCSQTGEFAGLHVFYDRAGKHRFTQSECERIYPEILEQFVDTIRNLRRLPMPEVLIVERETVNQPSPKPVAPVPAKLQPAAPAPRHHAPAEVAATIDAEEEIPTIPMPKRAKRKPVEAAAK